MPRIKVNLRDIVNGYPVEREGAPEQWSMNLGVELRGRLELIPPLADEFNVYGSEETVERARAWALTHRYLLARGMAACAHGLYGFRTCPGDGCQGAFRQLDHANLWVPYDCTDSPFILAHPYAEEVTEDTYAYARAHGLTVEVSSWDGWYSDATIPIRLALRDMPYLGPIEEQAIVLTTACPVVWPSDADDAQEA